MNLIADRQHATAFFTLNPIDWKTIKSNIPNTPNEIDWQFWLTAYPNLEDAKTTEQDPIYHAEGNVWIHTQMVVTEMVKSPWYIKADRTTKVVLFLSALLHDVAKAYTTTIDPETQRIGHPYHSPEGAILTRRLLWLQGFPFAIREEICNIIHNHQRPFYLLKQNSPEHIIHKLSWELNVSNLLTMAHADIKGRINADNPISLNRLKKLVLFARQQAVYQTPKSYIDATTRRVYARTKQGDPNIPVELNFGSNVILLAGLPASGKNHWITQNAANLPTVSFDDSQNELGLKYGEDHLAVANRTFAKADKLLAEKAPFIWNATNISRTGRQDILDRLYKQNAKVTIIYLESCAQTILARNNARSDATYVPLVGMQKMLSYWDVPKPWEADEVVYQINE